MRSKKGGWKKGGGDKIRVHAKGGGHIKWWGKNGAKGSSHKNKGGNCRLLEGGGKKIKNLQREEEYGSGAAIRGKRESARFLTKKREKRRGREERKIIRREGYFGEGGRGKCV